MAVKDLDDLDDWRETVHLEPIASYLQDQIENYFARQNPVLYVPGKPVSVQGEMTDVRMVLIWAGRRVKPYKVFFRRSVGGQWLILRVRHPFQLDIRI